jgi:hypothetical protein
VGDLKFDPSKVSGAGVHSYRHIPPVRQKSASRLDRAPQPSEEELWRKESSGWGSSPHDWGDEYDESGGYAPEQYHEKLATTGTELPNKPLPEQSEMPRFSYEEDPPIDQSSVDLRAGTAKQRERLNPKDVIQKRIKGLREKQIRGDQNLLLKKEREQDEAQFKAHQGTPTSIDVERPRLNDDTQRARMYPDGTNVGAYHTNKNASGPLALLADEEAHPVQLMVELTAHWPEDWVEWEPETIIHTAEEAGIDMPTAVQNKVMAIKVLLRTTRFWEDPFVFEKVCLSFADRYVDWGIVGGLCSAPRRTRLLAA